MSSSQNEHSDKRPDNLVDELGTSFSELALKTDDELQRQTSPEATRYTTTGSNTSRDDRIVTDGILSTSIFPDETRNHFSLPDHGLSVTNDSTHEDETFPAFLGEARVVAALRRAGDLFQQRHGLNGTTPLAPPASDWARLRALHGLPPFVANSEPELPFPALPAPPRSLIQGYADTRMRSQDLVCTQNSRPAMSRLLCCRSPSAPNCDRRILRIGDHLATRNNHLLMLGSLFRPIYVGMILPPFITLGRTQDMLHPRNFC
jgi:hypothetical protein